jgi:hypothetical protein
MNKYQNVVGMVALANIGLMLLFPPFVDSPLQRGEVPSFAGFYPLLAGLPLSRIHSELLTLEIMFVIINALAAWLVLNEPAQPQARKFNFVRGIALFVVADLLLIMAFPPFEPYSYMLTHQIQSFDGFYFILGDKRHRHFYLPLLHMEAMLIALNALIVWLTFSVMRRGEIEARDKIIQLATTLKPDEVMALSEALRQQVMEQQQNANIHHYGFGNDRRKRTDPRYKGPERRQAGERRKHPRAE